VARPSRRPGRLPAEATSFVGRRRELLEVRNKLAAGRVVSLVGPGGVGKTRLALRAATNLARGFSAGAWWVELGEVREPTLVCNAVLSALDLRDQAATEPLALLLAYLRDKELLLVVDNCEHLLGAAAGVANEVIAAAPGVRLIVTSREPLSIPGENVVPVPPLDLPPANAAGPLHELRQNEAVMLFVERAESASGSFELTAANRGAVADLCRRLDGLPLALELAAVRTRVLSVEQIVERLADRFGLLTGGGRAALPRHQTLQTAIDWSHDLLTDAERALFRRLCVFAGRFTLEDVEAVCADGDALEPMSSLVDKSLVIKEDARGVACYRLHETMREYARAKLGDAGETEMIGERCTSYYVTRCQSTALEARFRLLEWLPWMDLEIDNIRAILGYCLARGDSVRGIDLVTSLSWFWITRATTEGVRWLDELLASGPGNPETLAWSYFLRGFLAVLQGDSAAAEPVLEQAIAVSREQRLPIQLAHALSMASIAQVLAGDLASARRFLDEAESVASQVEDVATRVAILQARCLNAIFEADVDAVTTAATEGERLSREAGDHYARHMMLLNLGGAALFAGDLARSKPLYEEALRIAYQVDDRIGQFYLLAALAYHAATAGQSRVAAQLLGASDTIRAGAGATVMAMLAPYVEQAEEAATRALGAAKFRAEFETGRAMTRDAAVRLALGENEAPAKASSHRDAEILGKREADVARLVADGLSNKQIAARLFLSERTVDSHVRSILNKLGFNSRAQIAGWFRVTETASPSRSV
jgi:predicted ATPase/DNA-binding CsgD family transcriptional regulator